MGVFGSKEPLTAQTTLDCWTLLEKSPLHPLPSRSPPPITMAGSESPLPRSESPLPPPPPSPPPPPPLPHPPTPAIPHNYTLVAIDEIQQPPQDFSSDSPPPPPPWLPPPPPPKPALRDNDHARVAIDVQQASQARLLPNVVARLHFNPPLSVYLPEPIRLPRH